MTIFQCPYAKIVPLKCDKLYVLNMFYKDLERVLVTGKPGFCTISAEFKCETDPELCPRYIQHMIANIQKYKHR